MRRVKGWIGGENWLVTVVLIDVEGENLGAWIQIIFLDGDMECPAWLSEIANSSASPGSENPDPGHPVVIYLDEDLGRLPS
jgi:hypothetical protein